LRRPSEKKREIAFPCADLRRKNAKSHFLAQIFGEKTRNRISLRRYSGEKSDVAFSCADIRKKKATSYFFAQVFWEKKRRRISLRSDFLATKHSWAHRGDCFAVEKV
jgi:hypothetical protein